MIVIHGKQLTPFGVAPDGESFALHMTDEAAQPVSLILPSDCLSGLLMSLPEIIARCLRLRFGEPSLRVVYPVERWDVERSPVPGRVVVTLRTPDGFAISFSLPALDLLRLSSHAATSDPDSPGPVSS